MTGGIAFAWNEEALATIVELLGALIRVQLAAHGAKKHQLPKPIEVERPYDMVAKKRRPKRPATVEEVVGSLSSIFAPRK